MKLTIEPDVAFLKAVRPVLRKSVEECNRVLPLKKPIMINLAKSFEKFVIQKMDGGHGRTVDMGNIELFVSTEAKNWKQSVRSTIAHEFNHAARLQYTRKSWEGFKVIDTIASEGLAQCFAEQVTGYKAPYSHAISEKKARAVWRNIKPLLGKADHEIYKTIFLLDSKKFPHWSGYTVSYMIVKKKVEELGLPWEKLMRMDSRSIVGKGL
jgi:uncharacterized protein YjaZ